MQPLSMNMTITLAESAMQPLLPGRSSRSLSAVLTGSVSFPVTVTLPVEDVHCTACLSGLHPWDLLVGKRGIGPQVSACEDLKAVALYLSDLPC